jgi:mRNA-degrading endonuclease RelE of RelBE toxin-antitoxin system
MPQPDKHPRVPPTCPLSRDTQYEYPSLSVSFRETPRFTERFLALAGEDDLFQLKAELAENPEKGNVIPGTGGARKIRVGLAGRGKRGGGRVIYYVRVSCDIIWFLEVYAKNEKVDLDWGEKSLIAEYIRGLKAEEERK